MLPSENPNATLRYFGEVEKYLKDFWVIYGTRVENPNATHRIPCISSDIFTNKEWYFCIKIDTTRNSLILIGK